MKTLLLLLILIGGVSTSFSQFRVALHHLGNTSIYAGNQPFVDAYNASTDGDTIYLPGAGLNVPATIDKRLVIIGAGIHLDSTLATTRTILNSGFSIGPNADKLHLEGLYINGGITFDSDTKIDSVLILRNYINGGINIGGATATNLSNGVLIKENYINGAINGQHTNALIIQNNFLKAVSNLAYNAWVSNNLFYGVALHQFTNITETLFENNVVDYHYGNNNVVNCTFINNLFDTNPTVDVNNVFIGNYINISVPSVLVNFQNIPDFAIGNFHLISPATYLGTTGDEIGVFGGYSPMKEGAVPMNPHIMTKTIAAQTTPTGELNINITVGAQDN
jgi:hypothetical protein